MKFNVSAFALAFGIWWGAGIFLMTWWLIAIGAAVEPTIFERIYVGYSVTPLGSVVGLIWGFVCGTICGGIFAWLYNALAKLIGSSTGHLIDRPT